MKAKEAEILRPSMSIRAEPLRYRDFETSIPTRYFQGPQHSSWAGQCYNASGKEEPMIPLEEA